MFMYKYTYFAAKIQLFFELYKYFEQKIRKK